MKCALAGASGEDFVACAPLNPYFSVGRMRSKNGLLGPCQASPDLCDLGAKIEVKKTQIIINIGMIVIALSRDDVACDLPSAYKI